MKNNGEYEVGDIVQRSGKAWRITEVIRNTDSSVTYHMAVHPEVVK